MDHVFGLVRAILHVQSESMHKKGQPRSDLPMQDLVDTFSLLFKTLASKTQTTPKTTTGHDFADPDLSHAVCQKMISQFEQPIRDLPG